MSIVVTQKVDFMFTASRQRVREKEKESQWYDCMWHVGTGQDSAWNSMSRFTKLTFCSQHVVHNNKLYELIVVNIDNNLLW